MTDETPRHTIREPDAARYLDMSVACVENEGVAPVVSHDYRDDVIEAQASDDIGVVAELVEARAARDSYRELAQVSGLRP